MVKGHHIVEGRDYLDEHLRLNDYYCDEQTQGKWLGKLAEELGLVGEVRDADFEALRLNQTPNGEGKLTVGNRTRVATDFTINAPKDVSVLGMIAGDRRVVELFDHCVETTFTEMEKFAQVRIRGNGMRHSDENRLTENLVSAVFRHDASRDLDPQLHAHCVTFNVTRDPEDGQLRALQNGEIFAALGYAREHFYAELAVGLEALGYETYEHNEEGFRIRGVEHLAERYSSRSAAKERFIQKYRDTFGREPSKVRIDHFIRESAPAAALRFGAEYQRAFGEAPQAELVESFIEGARAEKLRSITTDEVRQLQRNKLTIPEQHKLERLVRGAERKTAEMAAKSPRIPLKTREPVSGSEIIGSALKSVFERKSVAKTSEVFEAALRFYRGAISAEGLWRELKAHPDTLQVDHRLTLRSILEEERVAIQFVGEKTNQLGTIESLPRASLNEGQGLSEDQFQAAKILCESDTLGVIFEGRAGTGKTFTLQEIEKAHLAAGGKPFLALGPTGRARDELKDNGFEDAVTVARYLVDEQMQEAGEGRVLLVDEAGLLSTRDLALITKLARQRNNRIIFAGDVRQHSSVERGDALRNLIEAEACPMGTLTEVRRQRLKRSREKSEALSEGRVNDAFQIADELGQIHEIGADHELFKTAAGRYADILEGDGEVLVVSPTWKDIDRFNEAARSELKKRELIEGPEIDIDGVESLSWTSEEKRQLADYQTDQVLVFHRRTAEFEKGESVRVLKHEGNHLMVERASGERAKVFRKQASAYDVCRPINLSIAKGDRLLFRANLADLGINNGETRQVAAVDSKSKTITLEDGQQIPPDFVRFCHGHAVTSHKSQGATVDQSMLVLSEDSLGAVNLPQWYVSTTRYRDEHEVFTTVREEIEEQLRRRQASVGRPLARELLARSADLLTAAGIKKWATQPSPAANQRSLVDRKRVATESLTQKWVRRLARLAAILFSNRTATGRARSPDRSLEFR